MDIEGRKALKVRVNDPKTRFRVAVLTYAGATQEEIGKELGLSRPSVAKIQEHEDVKKSLEDILTKDLLAARANICKEVSKLSLTIVEAIKAKIQEGNVEAIKVGLKILGFEGTKESSNAGSVQNLTVVLPGGSFDARDASTQRPKEDIEIKLPKLGGDQDESSDNERGGV